MRRPSDSLTINRIGDTLTTRLDQPDTFPVLRPRTDVEVAISKAWTAAHTGISDVVWAHVARHTLKVPGVRVE
jgi:hypothetical protein